MLAHLTVEEIPALIGVLFVGAMIGGSYVLGRLQGARRGRR
jgi:membrane protein DedA with SNARE-associated domain